MLEKRSERVHSGRFFHAFVFPFFLGYNSAMERDRCYALLDLEPGASRDEVRQVYRDLVHVWHPDRFAHNPRLRQKAEEKLKEVNRAYAALMEAEAAGRPIDRRRHPRTVCALALNHAAGGRTCSSCRDTILDISASGVFIGTRETLTIGERITLSFSLPRFGDLFNVGAEVVRCSADGVGVRFLITPRYQQFLAAFV